MPAAPDLEALQQELRDLHAASVKAHLEGDAEFFARDLDGDYTIVSGADIIHPTADEVRAQFTEYLSSTEFSAYDTTDGPIVGVSDDGSVGWIITRVEVQGQQIRGEERRAVGFASAWISLYRRIGGRWVMLANVSNVVPTGSRPKTRQSPG